VKRLSTAGVLLVIFVPLSALFADQTVKKRMSVSGNSFDSTSYIKGERSRDEMNFGPMRMITIHQCDTGKVITLNDSTKTYMVTTESQPGAGAAPATAPRAGAPRQSAPPPDEDAGPQGGARKGGTITFNTSVTDTGERKQMFGYTARHVKTSITAESSPDACNPGSFQMSSDGWYIDFTESHLSCIRPERQMMEGPMAPGGRQRRPDCEDKIKYTGPGIMALTRLGYPVDVTTTFSGKDGQSGAMRQQALDISRSSLDPGLFEPPAGYRQVSSYSEMMGFGGMMGAMMGNSARNRAGATTQRAPAPTPEVRFGAGRLPAPTPEVRGRMGKSGFGVARAQAPTPEVHGGVVGQKIPGKLRVGVVTIGDRSSRGLNGNGLRDQLITQLARFGYDVVQVEGPDQAPAMADAKSKDCDYVVFTDVTAKDNTKKKIGGFLSRATGMSSASGSNDFQGTVQYRLFRMGVTSPSLDKAAETSSGSADEVIGATFDRESRDVATQIQKEQAAR